MGRICIISSYKRMAKDFMVYGDFDNPNTIHTSSPIIQPFPIVVSYTAGKKENFRDCITKRKELNKYSTKLCLDIIIIFEIKPCNVFPV